MLQWKIFMVMALIGHILCGISDGFLTYASNGKVDLMVPGIKNSIEGKLPILNRVNPAVLVTDCLYALNVYDNYDRYFRNILILTGMAVCLLGASILVLRRNKYASV